MITVLVHRGGQSQRVESLDPASLSPLLQSGATQCGACTPGVVVTAAWIRDNASLLSTHSIRELMAGNLCRCTGYDGIVDGIQASLSSSALDPKRGNLPLDGSRA